ncbi:MAG: glutamyl-tRNA reductase [Pirellulaceae bacterium]|nr:glutamyl-tRNA reductase [Pirellulaceae bacterium]
MNMMMIGCSHKETSISIREKIAFSPEQTKAALAQFYSLFPGCEAVLLSTCNRTEIYTAAKDQTKIPASNELIQFVADFHGLDTHQLSSELFERTGEEVIAHLFTVAASLDSMVVGEAQILSQVKQAYELATGFNESMPMSHVAFQRAIHVAKRIATETRIHARRVSIPSVAISELATEIFERFDDKTIIVVGAGEMAEETLTYLVGFGAKDIRLINRTAERAEKLAKQFNAKVYPWEELETQLIQADMVVSATSAQEPILTLERYRAIERKRNQQTFFVLDLAIPRDFEPAIGDCSNVFLYSVDDLQAQCDENRAARKKELPKAFNIIKEEANKFMSELSHRETIPTIRQLRKQANELKGQELERLLHKLEPLDEHSRSEIQYAFDRLVNKLLHPPLESLRDEADLESPKSMVDALRKLFKLRD